MLKFLVDTDSSMSRKTHALKSREKSVKMYICSSLEEAVAELLETVVDRSLPVELNETMSKVLTCLEAIFIHRLRDSFMERVTSVFSAENSRQPEPNFWTLILSISHKHQILILNESQYLTTDIGRCRAWIRIVLNEGIFENFIETLRRDSRLLSQFYEKDAFLKDNDAVVSLRKQLTILSNFYFDLPTNSSLLNKWTSSPLGLAGLWIPSMAITPEAVVQGCDVAETLSSECSDTQKSCDQEAIFERLVRTPSVSSSLCGGSPQRTPVGSVPSNTSCYQLFSHREDADSITNSSVEISTDQFRSSSVASIEVETQTCEADFDLGSKVEVGGSSVVELGKTTVGTNENTYETLLVTYSEDQGLSRTPVKGWDLTGPVDIENAPSVMSPSTSMLSPKVISGFEVIEKEKCPKPSSIVAHILSKVPIEEGLDSQEYQCRECKRPIGIIFGEARVCHVTSKYYCEDCHENEQLMIPSRIVYNWDFRLYPVSSSSALFLKQISADPVINIMDLNPRLYSYTEELRLVKDYRSQLVYTNAYLETCKSDAKAELRKRLWPREYLYEHIHLYSLSDLSQLAIGSLIPTLKKTVDLCIAHVRGCHLCKSKGFICELCKNPNPIYPFDIQLTHRCSSCGLVCHLPCIDPEKPCTRCERIRKRKLAS